VWWLSLIAGVMVFAASLLIVERRKLPTEDYIVDGVSKAELSEAIDLLTQASGRMRRLALAATGDDKTEFNSMAKLFEAIRGHHTRDPRDYQHTRRFIRHDLPRIVDTAESYAELKKRASGKNRDRVEALGTRIRNFTPVLEKIDQACLENDFLALEVQVEVLGDQLETR
jgi:5-bromo-4-chloroindolyl phosphate hydrolysis protein